MDLTHSRLDSPPIAIRFAPVFWEPYAGSGEKIVALLVLEPRSDSLQLIEPKAYSVLPEKRLISMLGKTKGTSAHAILLESALYLSKRLKAGLSLSEALPPFEGFSVGSVRRSSGHTVRQVLEAATRSVSAFGSAEEIFPEEPEIARHATTTREFLNRIRKSDFGVGAKDRFNKKLKVSLTDLNAPEVTIDYCHSKIIVQATSLPSSNYQELDLKKEAESKLFEIVNLQQFTQNSWIPKLFLNVEALDLTGHTDALEVATRTRAVIEYYARAQNVEVVAVHSSDDAVSKLAALG